MENLSISYGAFYQLLPETRKKAEQIDLFLSPVFQKQAGSAPKRTVMRPVCQISAQND